MAVDVTKGRMTEVEHINGYLIALGQRLGVETPCHRMVREMVKFTAEVNGLKPDIRPVTVERVGDRRERIQSRLGRGRKLTPREMDIEEKRLELEERRLALAEEQVQDAKRVRRRATKAGFRAKQREAKQSATVVEVPAEPDVEPSLESESASKTVEVGPSSFDEIVGPVDPSEDEISPEDEVLARFGDGSGEEDQTILPLLSTGEGTAPISPRTSGDRTHDSTTQYDYERDVPPLQSKSRRQIAAMSPTDPSIGD